jgi:methyl-accepting chemotaxis protein-1 (serine sensor receptor)
LKDAVSVFEISDAVLRTQQFGAVNPHEQEFSLSAGPAAWR